MLDRGAGELPGVRHLMRSFWLASLSATRSVSATMALSAMLDEPSARRRSSLRARYSRNSKAAMRLFPSVKGWSLMTN